MKQRRNEAHGVASALAAMLVLAACGEQFQPATQAEGAGDGAPASRGGSDGAGGHGGSGGEGGTVGSAGGPTDGGGAGGREGDAASLQDGARDAGIQDAAAFDPSTQTCDAAKPEGDASCDPFCERAGFVWGYCGEYPVGHRCGCSDGPQDTTCVDDGTCDPWSCDRVCEVAGWLAGRVVAGKCQCVAAGQFIQKPAAACGSACGDGIDCLPCPAGFECKGGTCCEMGAC